MHRLRNMSGCLRSLPRERSKTSLLLKCSLSGYIPQYAGRADVRPRGEKEYVVYFREENKETSAASPRQQILRPPSGNAVAVMNIAILAAGRTPFPEVNRVNHGNLFGGRLAIK